MSLRENDTPPKYAPVGYLSICSPGFIVYEPDHSEGYRDLKASFIAFVTSLGKQTGEYPPGLL